MTPDIDVAFTEGLECDEKEIISLVQLSVTKAVMVAELEFPKNAELSVLIADDKTLQKLNQEWRDKDKPTNVLSFPTEITGLGTTTSPLLGDIAISIETAKREADLENKSLNSHLTHLIIHGFLHLFGYDHETDEEAIRMESLETKILEELGIPDPYQV